MEVQFIILSTASYSELSSLLSLVKKTKNEIALKIQPLKEKKASELSEVDWKLLNSHSVINNVHISILERLNEMADTVVLKEVL